MRKEILREDIVIIGGGLGGLTAAILLAKNDRSVVVIEKKAYPFHRVCGEYISNEVKAFLQKEDLYPADLHPVDVERLTLSSMKGKRMDIRLDLGGFGISRYAFDEYLYQKAKSYGVEFKLQKEVLEAEYIREKDHFQLVLKSGETLLATQVLGAFGKRSALDRTLARSFIRKRTPYIGVKYHIKGDFDRSTIALHLFNGGYCGLNPVENDLFNLCYLGNKQQLRDCGSIRKMEERFLFKNPYLAELFARAEFMRDQPEVINEINFEPKLPVENHLLMIGDAAGMIAPLCGNGMAIAIHCGKLAADAILSKQDRLSIERQYQKNWDHHFKGRLKIGRTVQRLFDYPLLADVAITLLRKAPSVANQIMKRTHGEVF